MPVPAKLGTNRNPHGDVIAVNSQYLTFNGKPWIPVMGEFHFSRYPQAQWEEEILKMKAAGVSIISTYVIWIHHEEKEGTFDWSGQRDLRTFVQLCAKHGMYVYPRIGPWAHAETRNGGLPDWVVKNGPVRQNDPVYLREVATFDGQIAQQLHGLLWKDGGPVIGVQIENEYRDTGPGKGDEHIRTLKDMALHDGLDVPLYTVTGWDGAAIPLDAALPVFGGYPDAPWDGSPQKLSANEVYAFRFANRSAGSMGAIGGKGQGAASSYRGTPFLTAEVGAGMQDTYFRRPVVSADDIASIAPVMLGSGANLLGYYMFHGGRNPEGTTTLQESQRTGYPTDVPVKSYDFQAPIGEFGQERPSLRKMKLVHYFLEDFGAELAPMLPHAPSVLPQSPADLSVPRVAARTLGDAGFLFFNNHIRGVSAQTFAGFQVELQLPAGTLRVPAQPIDLAPDAYGIWPVNLHLGSAILRYATAQLFKRVRTGDETNFFFFAIPGVSPELMLAPDAKVLHMTGAVQQSQTPAGLRLRMSTDSASSVQLEGGTTLVVLPRTQAENVWRGDDAGILMSTGADAFADGDQWTLQSTGDRTFSFGVFGSASRPSSPAAELQSAEGQYPFQRYELKVPAVSLHIEAQPVRAPDPPRTLQMGASFSWRPQPLPLAPDDGDFSHAAVWKLQLPAVPPAPQLADVFLRIRYQGDAARLSSGATLLDDSFWNGIPWEIGLRETGLLSGAPQTLQLRILPLPKSFPMYIENADQLSFPRGVADALSGIELVPRYQVKLNLTPSK